jgi:ADP-ribose pyrophosphatase YjhB (NUDIX family)
LNPIVRPTGILIEDDRLLIVKQEASEQPHWVLPGGHLEFGETIEQCLVREIKEETGLDVKLKDMLYICDRFRHLNNHIVHITFLIERVGQKLPLNSFFHKDEEINREVKMIPVDELMKYGFSQTFYQLVKDNFPNRGSYQGDFHKFYGEP